MVFIIQIKVYLRVQEIAGYIMSILFSLNIRLHHPWDKTGECHYGKEQGSEDDAYFFATFFYKPILSMFSVL